MQVVVDTTAKFSELIIAQISKSEIGILELFGYIVQWGWMLFSKSLKSTHDFSRFWRIYTKSESLILIFCDFLFQLFDAAAILDIADCLDDQTLRIKQESEQNSQKKSKNHYQKNSSFNFKWQREETYFYYFAIVNHEDYQAGK